MITIKIPFLHHAIQLNLYKFRFRGGGNNFKENSFD